MTQAYLMELDETESREISQNREMCSRLRDSREDIDDNQVSYDLPGWIFREFSRSRIDPGSAASLVLR
jgi:hypothetical protein